MPRTGPNWQHKQRRTISSQRLEALSVLGTRSRQLLRREWEFADSPVWGTYQALIGEAVGWEVSDKVCVHLLRLRLAGRLSKLEAHTYARDHRTNPNSKVAKDFIQLVEMSGKAVVRRQRRDLRKGEALGWVGYSASDRVRMLALKGAGDEVSHDWDAFYYASTREQAEGYGEVLARVQARAGVTANVLRANDVFFASMLPGEYKADRIKKALGLDVKVKLLPYLGAHKAQLHIVEGLEGFDAEHELEHIVPWPHARKFLQLAEVDD